ncbi:hypothetical protein [Pararcticibacter amylolyticus]|uniref:Uncharacterized protein n=1 Tax=Pararcticibacter amylolyticus TaxID=2173175 RepID=A0A2U2PHF9_9SPHI|nr:hypothetical protein [Pararcticibacter amylolyticus]PWG80810.1 hypothetical protein DDR33_10155 [Pararcticibacter amylolyticus]
MAVTLFFSRTSIDLLFLTAGNGGMNGCPLEEIKSIGMKKNFEKQPERKRLIAKGLLLTMTLCVYNLLCSIPLLAQDGSAGAPR